MDVYRILLDGHEVARISGEALELGQRGTEPDVKCIKKIVKDQTLFVVMVSTRSNVTVEKV